MAESPTVLVMAAGRGTRMRSPLPKVLHPLCGLPMLHWVVDAARGAGAGRVLCITRPGDGVREGMPEGAECVEQREGEGTGSAILAAANQVDAGSTVLVLSGDQPLITSQILGDLLVRHRNQRAAATILTTSQLDPAGYGRIVRAGDGRVERIIETKHTDGLTEQELRLREVNLGTYAFAADDLFSTLTRVPETDGERYLTGVFPLLREEGRPIAAHQTLDASSAKGVNSRVDLMEVERLARRRIVEGHAHAGVTFVLPDTAAIDHGVEIGEETRIEPGVTIRGGCRIGRACEVGPHTTLIDVELGDEVRVPHSYLVECIVEDGALVGPFAYLRPGAHLEPGAKAGTFVEVKNSRLRKGAKVPHLSYIGDADVGERANVGAGAITANYDGRRKHRTRIGAGAKTSVHTAFVAPVDVGAGAYTGAGSVITEDVPDGALGIARARQTNIDGYAKRVEERQVD
jgi:bifunctional UDP-N-acetylglucosamine pyrophosphorylase/glucosamine-1-phosphate N-acetyltransferase